MLRAHLDVNGRSIGTIAARRTRHVDPAGNCKYRVFRYIRDADEWRVGEVWHHPAEGATELVALAARVGGERVADGEVASRYINGE